MSKTVACNINETEHKELIEFIKQQNKRGINKSNLLKMALINLMNTDEENRNLLLKNAEKNVYITINQK